MISYLSSQELQNKFLITTQFNQVKAANLTPIVSICFDKILVSPIIINNYLDNKPDGKKMEVNLSFLVCVPLKFGPDICYDIFSELSDILMNNNIGISFNFISCSNIEFLKSMNCFNLNINSAISIILEN